MFALATAAPFIWIRPAFAISTHTDGTCPPTSRQIVYQSLQICPIPPDLQSISAGDQITIPLDLKVLETMDEDSSIFVHLVDTTLNTPIAQRDKYPGNGRLATSVLVPNQLYQEQFTLTVPETVFVGDDAQICIGLYNFQTQQRLTTPNGTTTTCIATLPITAKDGQYPTKPTSTSLTPSNCSATS